MQTFLTCFFYSKLIKIRSFVYIIHNFLFYNLEEGTDREIWWSWCLRAISIWSSHNWIQSWQSSWSRTHKFRSWADQPAKADQNAYTSSSFYYPAKFLDWGNVCLTDRRKFCSAGSRKRNQSVLISWHISVRWMEGARERDWTFRIFTINLNEPHSILILKTLIFILTWVFDPLVIKPYWLMRLGRFLRQFSKQLLDVGKGWAQISCNCLSKQ